ncbi:hypothetical protein D3C86_1136220 [compost metagenome]
MAAGVVDQEVQPPELLDHLLDDLLAVGGVREVALDGEALAAGLADPAQGLLGVVVLVEVGDRDVGPLAGEGDRDRPADAAVAAGHQGLASEQLVGATVALFAVVGGGAHLGLVARPGLGLGRLLALGPRLGKRVGIDGKSLFLTRRVGHHALLLLEGPGEPSCRRAGVQVRRMVRDPARKKRRQAFLSKQFGDP